MVKKLFLVLSHGAMLAFGFALGIYLLPILTAPPSADSGQMQSAVTQARYHGEFKRDLKGSDFFHWGEGKVSIGNEFVSLQGEIAPGPDYRLYLSPVFVEDEAEFLANKSKMKQVAEVKSFNNFVVPIKGSVEIENYTTMIIWCEAFGEFITAAKYR